MGKISARIYSLTDGYQSMSGLKGIRIVSSNYNILVMEDFLPIIGQIEGDVTFIYQDSQKTISNIKGYYRHAHNEFELLIKSDANDRSSN